MAPAAKDMVISYMVGQNGVVPVTYEPLQKALDDGWRVIDVLPESKHVGGGGSGFGTVVVTVLLSKDGGTYYKPAPKAS